MTDAQQIELNQYIISIRRELHKIPETAFKEFKTTKFIEDELNSLNIQNFRLLETGVIGIIGDAANPCIGFRADIDALPLMEDTGLPFSSTHDGVMHACGHDFHISMLLGAARYLKSIEDSLSVCIKLIFQPAEEMIPGGAKLLVEAGVLKNPDVRMVFGQHIHPSKRVGRIEIAPGPAMASSDEMYWTIKGKSSHAATPHLGNDPVLAASNMIANLQSVITKHRNPLMPSVLSITSIHGGTATNILPEEVKIMGTFRAYNDEWRYETIETIRKISSNICDAYNCESIFEPKMGFPAVINDKNASDIAASAAQQSVGEENFSYCDPMMWGEDFSYYSNEVPSCFWFLGVQNKDDMPPLHNVKLAPDESALMNGFKMFINIANIYNSKSNNINTTKESSTASK